MWVNPPDPDGITILCPQALQVILVSCQRLKQDLDLRRVLQALGLLTVTCVWKAKVLKESTEPLMTGTAKCCAVEILQVRLFRGITVP